jgi:hypothetical protein
MSDRKFVEYPAYFSRRLATLTNPGTYLRVSVSRYQLVPRRSGEKLPRLRLRRSTSSRIAASPFDAGRRKMRKDIQ